MKVKPATKLVNTGEFPVADRRFSHVMLDIVGPLPVSYGYRFLLTAICRTSRMVQAIPLKEASSSEAAAGFLHHWAAIWGIPSLVTSDNGASFTSNLWKDMLEKLNITVKYSALYRPQAIGMLERQHQILKNSLKVFPVYEYPLSHPWRCLIENGGPCWSGICTCSWACTHG